MNVERHVIPPSDSGPNSHLPVVIYRDAVADGGDLAGRFEEVFAANGWRGAWRDTVYAYDHFHTNEHEVLGVARGTIRVRFGGSSGIETTLKSGDAVVIPAGVAHRRVQASGDVLIVGAYPRGHEPDLKVDGDLSTAMKHIAKVKLPDNDPVMGANGPLLQAWR